MAERTATGTWADAHRARFSPGWHVTRGLDDSTLDDWSLAELTLIWHANPVYTNSYWCHSSAASRSLWNFSAVFVRSR
jgi:hypothetical protein